MATYAFPKPRFHGKRQSRYYKPVRWNVENALRALAFVHQCIKRHPRFFRRFIGRQIETLHLLRVPLLTLLLLFFLPWLALRTWPALLENLLLDLDKIDVAVSAMVAFLTAAAAVAAVNATFVNGHERFPPLTFGRVYGAPLEWLIIAAPAPLVLSIVSQSRDGILLATLGAFAGLLAALLIIAVVRVELLEHGRRMRRSGLKSWRPRPLVFPHAIPFLDRGTGSRRPLSICVRPAWWIYRAIVGIGGILKRIVGWFRLNRVSNWIGAKLKSLLLDAGYIYVPDDSKQRPLYSAHRHLLLLLTALMATWASLTYAKGFELWQGKTAVALFPVPTLAYVTLTLWLACLVLAAITFWIDRYRIPLLAVLILWAIVGSSYLGTDHFYDTKITALSRSRSLEPASILDSANRRKVILVAAAGGGIQAAAWTARVLTGLESEIPRQFSRSVALLSGVSGGAVGVYYFADSFTEGFPNAESLRRAQTQAMQSSLEDVAWGVAAPDLLRALVPLRFSERWKLMDRGWALERSLLLRSNDRYARLSDWENDLKNGMRPAVILNATLVESGRPLLFGTTRVRGFQGAGSWYDAVDFRNLPLVSQGQTPQAPDVLVATAARLSATFPFVSPVATSNHSGPIELSQHVADGGYYDNFGMMSLMMWLHEGLQRADHPPTDVLVLQIRSFPEAELPPREHHRSWVFQSYAPLTALMSVRTAAQRLRNEQEFNYLQCYWKELGVNIESLVVDYETDPTYDDPDPPLSWSLRSGQKHAIERAWSREANQQSDRVRRFLTSGAAQDCVCAK